ncbi:serine/threonine protein kinase [Litchfieldia alkalitelluris]|uniref:serine/threonine protein kinase n=1 Tax=Litchfieldia alkalitelluris TaxID=304268 RepID=UPI000995F21B|nr:protein kinase family protein [Litchfieldia alkalitelluris]
MLTKIFEIPFKSGTIVDSHYKITRFIGKGSYGLVYKATELKTNQFVVIKQLRQRKRKKNSKLLAREVENLKSLDHPFIPKLLNYFKWEERYFLVMEFKPGENFEELVLFQGKKYSEIECLQILLKVLKVVKYLHEECGIIHRDLRLPNIIYDHGQIYLIDFGLALSYTESTDDLSEVPKSHHKRSFREISLTSDFYALGHFLLFLLYSNYEIVSKKESSWEDELDLHPSIHKMIRKLLKLDEGYVEVDEIINDVKDVIKIIK